MKKISLILNQVKSEIVSKYLAGTTVEDLSKEYKISQSTIYRHVISDEIIKTKNISKKYVMKKTTKYIKDEVVLDIVDKINNKKNTVTELSNLYGISAAHIYNIMNGIHRSKLTGIKNKRIINKSTGTTISPVISDAISKIKSHNNDITKRCSMIDKSIEEMKSKIESLSKQKEDLSSTIISIN